jgi:regulation of enolase protein 1 (concanavalin A-like superfamily)
MSNDWPIPTDAHVLVASGPDVSRRWPTDHAVWLACNNGSYGFVHDSEHTLIAPFALDSAMEVEFTASFSHQFDQAGIFISVSNERWGQGRRRFADGRPQIGAVVTDELSDWSLAPAPDWAGQRILIRVSRSGDALTIRAKPADRDDLQLIRVVPFEPELVALAGPYTCAPRGQVSLSDFTAGGPGNPTGASTRPKGAALKCS